MLAEDAPRDLGRYQMLMELASGGMGKVFLARVRGVRGFERLVAVKLCHPELANEPDFAHVIADEARLAAHIRHPNVVSTLDVGAADDGTPYLVMEYVEGVGLSTLIATAARERRPLSPTIAVRVSADFLAGLHAAHRTCDASGRPLGLIHRDVSPQNVLVGVDGVSRLIDFGVAKTEAFRTNVTRAGHLKGKLGYMSPEQLMNEPLSPASDVFSAAVVVWEMLTHRRLFPAKSGLTAAKLGEVRLDRPSDVGAQVGAALDDVVMKALDREPSRRYADAEAFAIALEAAVAPAASREVAEHVERLAGSSLRARRRRVREVLDGDSADRTPPQGDGHAAALDAGPVTVVLPSGDAGPTPTLVPRDPGAATILLAREGAPTAGPSPTRSRWRLAAAAVAVGGIAVVGLVPLGSSPGMPGVAAESAHERPPVAGPKSAPPAHGPSLPVERGSARVAGQDSAATTPRTTDTASSAEPKATTGGVDRGLDSNPRRTAPAAPEVRSRSRAAPATRALPRTSTLRSVRTASSAFDPSAI